jgi:hypothetical protein
MGETDRRSLWISEVDDRPRLARRVTESFRQRAFLLFRICRVRRSTNSVRIVTLAVVIIGTGVLSGCGKSLADVSGTVKKEGQPLADADLVFAQEGEAERVFYAMSVEGGKFQVDYGEDKGMPPGKYKITVTWYLTPDGKPLPEGEAGAGLKTSGRARTFTKDLHREIADGEVSLDLDVSKD